MTERPAVGPLITIGDPTNADLCVDGWCGPVDARPEPDTRTEGRPTMITIEPTEQERATGVQPEPAADEGLVVHQEDRDHVPLRWAGSAPDRTRRAGWRPGR